MWSALQNLDVLSIFLISDGRTKGNAASKSTLARWIRSCIVEAYAVKGVSPPKSIRAHSTRSLATSWADKEMASIQEVCRAAGWSSLHTFTKHYKVDILASAEARFGRRVLSAVV